MPKNSPCSHGACPIGKCKQLTVEELTPEPDDLDFAKKLIAEGYYSTSNQYRAVARLPAELSPENFLKPEQINTSIGREFVELWKRDIGFILRCGHGMARDTPFPVERLELTVKQYRAFKQLGGPTA